MARTHQTLRHSPSSNPQPLTIPCLGRVTQSPYSPKKRSEWTSYGCHICAYPSTCGLIVRENCDRVELEYLGFDPFDVPEETVASPGEEDEFCKRLRKIGGRWWSSYSRWSRCYESWESLSLFNTEEERIKVYVGWPENGVVLVLEGEKNELDAEIVGMLRMARGMEERCRVMRRWDSQAEFYEDAWEYREGWLMGREEE